MDHSCDLESLDMTIHAIEANLEELIEIRTNFNRMRGKKNLLRNLRIWAQII